MDHLRWRALVRQVADPWITLVAIATATEHLRLGPMVTPRPPPASQGRQGNRHAGPAQQWRLTLGVGLGSDRFGSELSKTGEQLDDRLRGQMWVADFGNIKSLRRAARHDGFFPANLEHPNQLAEIVATITDLRQHTTAPYDFAVGLPPGTDPAPYAKAGATWWLVEFLQDTMSADYGAACSATARGQPVPRIAERSWPRLVR